jgi:hypothetical protein
MDEGLADASPDFAGEVQWIVGVNVPWTVAWSAERDFVLRDSVLFPGKIEVGQIETPGMGSPLFAMNHVDRQRRGLALHLCHMCGEPTTPDDRVIFPAVSGGFVTMADGTRQYGGNVPPVHRACAERSRRQCPHLRRLSAEAVDYPAEEPRLIPRTDVPPGMEELAVQLRPGQEVVFACYRLFGPEFSRTVERLMGGE